VLSVVVEPGNLRREALEQDTSEVRAGRQLTQFDALPLAEIEDGGRIVPAIFGIERLVESGIGREYCLHRVKLPQSPDRLGLTFDYRELLCVSTGRGIHCRHGGQRYQREQAECHSQDCHATL
jgi:hypothetical protein